MEAGFHQGRRNELVGRIDSLKGWSEVGKDALKGGEYTESDERILGDTDFVAALLRQAEERFDRKYELKRLG
jgi:putative transposase